MADDDLSRAPHHHQNYDHWWWYEEPKGIAIVVDISKLDSHLKHKPVLEIPWRA